MNILFQYRTIVSDLIMTQSTKIDAWYNSLRNLQFYLNCKVIMIGVSVDRNNYGPTQRYTKGCLLP